jgi:hypothetical protein
MVLVILLVLTQRWWLFYTMLCIPMWANYFPFLLVVATIGLLYMVAALALPESATPQRAVAYAALLMARAIVVDQERER